MPPAETESAGTVTDRHLALFDNLQLDNEPAFQWQNGTPYTLTMVVRGNAFSCTVAGANRQQTVNGTSAVVARDGAAMELLAYGMTARIDWLFIAGAP